MRLTNFFMNSEKCKVVAAATIPALVMFISLTVYILNRSATDLEQHMHEKGNTISSLVVDLSETALISGNSQYIESSVKSLLNREGVNAIAIFKSDGSELLALRSKPGDLSSETTFTSDVYINGDIGDVAFSETIWDSGDTKSPPSKSIGKVVVNIDREIIQIKQKTIMFETLSFAAIILIVSICIGTLIGLNITKRLSKVSRLATSLSNGNYGKTEAFFGDNEITDLGNIINKMSLDLDTVTKERDSQLNELIVASEAADKANSSKAEFLGNITSEISIPLNHISGELNNLTKSGLNSNQQLYVERARGHLEFSLDLIDDLLEFAEYNHQEFAIKKRYFNFKDNFNRLISDNKIVANRKGLTVETEFSGDETIQDGYIKSDPVRIRQILQHLLSNAIKFTQSGTIYVHVHWRKINQERSSVKVEIIDTGVGINTDQYFELLELLQGVQPNERSFSHKVGRGLAISGILAKRIGARLTLTPSSENGLSVEMSLETDFSSHMKYEEAQSSSLEYIPKVLYVSDANQLNSATAQLLSMKQIEIKLVDRKNSIDEAINKQYDFIIIESATNIGLLANQIRQINNHQLTPIIAIVFSEHDKDILKKVPDLTEVIMNTSKKAELFEIIQFYSKSKESLDSIYQNQKIRE